jgi:ppGpp synthetase/RelA/SpoT-type nucleotidyltranferase
MNGYIGSHLWATYQAQRADQEQKCRIEGHEFY